ncbi:hypothetical protein PMAYCL1PPCAC_16106, partial [Pristionchus mayeri]
VIGCKCILVSVLHSIILFLHRWRILLGRPLLACAIQVFIGDFIFYLFLFFLKYFQVIQTFCTMSMIAAFGAMIIARHQLLMPDGATLKMKTSLKMGLFCACYCEQHQIIALSVAQASERVKVKCKVNLIKLPQLRWRERGLNWFLFEATQHSLVAYLSYYGSFLFIPACCALISIPLGHMLVIIL